MSLFHLIPDAAIVVRKKHVYKQAKLYKRGIELYVGINGGFIGLKTGGDTMDPHITWDYIEGVEYEGNGTYSRKLQIR